MFELHEADQKTRDAKERAERKAAAEILPFEIENQILADEQTLNRWAFPLGHLPARIEIHAEGSAINSRHRRTP